MGEVSQGPPLPLDEELQRLIPERRIISFLQGQAPI